MKTQKNSKYICEKCQFVSSNKNDYRRHLLTSKHKLSTLSTDIEFFSTETNIEDDKHLCSCGKKYKDRTGLWHHKKKCTLDNVSTINTLLENSPISETHHQELINEIKSLKTIVEELKSNGVNNHQTINNNTQNNQFNLQVYLNETCSNAINIDTLLKNIKVTIENVIEIGEIGYSKGIGNLIAKHIKGMNQIEKPIQTTDVKRGLSWIKNKNNEWIKDEDLTLANNFIFLVGDKYFREYADGITTIKEWKDTQSKIHDKVVESINQITKVIISDDKNKDYSKIHKTIAENTMVKK